MYDSNFLKQLDLTHNKIIYARITSLMLDERPVETIEGRVTSGSINVDGASAVRRSCQLTMISDKPDISDYLWGLDTKFKLEIGVQNTIDSKYPDIIWFKQGIYVITSFSQALSNNNYTINISGKDKMCLLNGEVSGVFNSSVDFGQYEEIDKNGNVKIIKMSILNIIREMVHQYGGEPFYNIIINDLDDLGLELQEYRYDTPLYLIRQKADETGEYMQATLNGKQIVYTGDINNAKQVYLNARAEQPLFIDEGLQKGVYIIPNIIESTLDKLEKYDSLFTSLTGEIQDSTSFTFEKGSFEEYRCAKIDYGETAGYKETELTYTGDLIANPGEAITSILDKIKNMLGNFEYFYDLDGRFVFQQQENYINTMWSPITDSDNVESLAIANSATYIFNGNELISAFNNTPNLSNLKNDYTVWGTKKGVTGNEIPIHMRYAIDTKPLVYQSIEVTEEELYSYNKKYNLKTLGQKSTLYLSYDPVSFQEVNGHKILALELPYEYFPEDKQLNIITDQQPSYNESNKCITVNINVDNIPIVRCDWREIIYQMAKDYRKYNHLDDFELKVAAANPDIYSTGKTGYEQYYIDMEGFWRQLYNMEIVYNKVNLPKEENFESYLIKKERYKRLLSLEEYGTEVYIQKADETYERVYYPYPPDYLYYKVISYEKPTDKFNEKGEYYQKSEQFYPSDHEHAYWNKDVYEAPNQLIFWIDFLDSEGELSQFSVRSVGARPKATNDKDVRSIYNIETPLIIFQSPTSQSLDNAGEKTGYRYFNIDETNFKEMFTPSTQGKSAKDAIDNLLYTHSYCIESVSLTTIPIYYLEPNKRIYIQDNNTGINGSYVISKMTIPLTYNGTMNITATKAVDRII